MECRREKERPGWGRIRYPDTEQWLAWWWTHKDEQPSSLDYFVHSNDICYSFQSTPAPLIKYLVTAIWRVVQIRTVSNVYLTATSGTVSRFHRPTSTTATTKLDNGRQRTNGPSKTARVCQACGHSNFVFFTHILQLKKCFYIRKKHFSMYSRPLLQIVHTVVPTLSGINHFWVRTWSRIEFRIIIHRTL